MRRVLLGVCGVFFFATVLIGTLHVPAFRAALAKVGGCPLAGDRDASAAEREGTRQRALAGERGVHAAPTSTLFGLALGTASRAAVDQVASGASCHTNPAGLVLECEFPSLASLGLTAPGTAFFRFDERQRLVAVVLMPRRDGSASFSEVAGTLSAALGPAHSSEGKAEASWLREGALRQARREHHFSDLIARVSITNLGDGLQVVAEAQWLPPVVAVR
jgi:hypothetical protein